MNDEEGTNTGTGKLSNSETVELNDETNALNIDGNDEGVGEEVADNDEVMVLEIHDEVTINSSSSSMHLNGEIVKDDESVITWAEYARTSSQLSEDDHVTIDKNGFDWDICGVVPVSERANMEVS